MTTNCNLLSKCRLSQLAIGKSKRWLNWITFVIDKNLCHLLCSNFVFAVLIGIYAFIYQNCYSFSVKSFLVLLWVLYFLSKSKPRVSLCKVHQICYILPNLSFDKWRKTVRVILWPLCICKLYWQKSFYIMYLYYIYIYNRIIFVWKLRAHFFTLAILFIQTPLNSI